MRKIATVLLALLLGVSALPAAATPGASASVDQFADADWIEMHGNTGTVYFAIGWRMASEFGLITLGAVGKGKCDRKVTRHSEIITCSASGRAKELGPNQFAFDPALRDASINFKSHGTRQRVKWQGRGRLPYFGGILAGGDGYMFAGAGVSRSARADARIFGRHLKTRGWMSFAGLGESAGAGVFTDYGRNITVFPDGSFDYRIEITRPR